jgi:AraC-like DNA-binding protein
VGFGNYSNFNRQFKRIKHFSPRELRAEFLSSPGTSRRASSSIKANPAAGMNRRKSVKPWPEPGRQLNT